MINHKNIKIKSMVKLITILFIVLLGLFITINFIFFRSFGIGSNITNEMFRSYISFSIGILVVLFLLLASVLMFIRKIVNIDIPYILRSFKNLSNFNYDMSPVADFIPFFAEEKQIKTFVENIYSEQVFLEQIKNIAANEYVLDGVLEKVFEKLNDSIRVDRIGVAFVNYGRESIIAETAKISYGNILLGSGFEVSMKDTSLTEIITTKKSKFNNDLTEERRKRKPRNGALDLIIGEGIKSNMIIPLVLENKAFGILFFSSFEKNNYDKKSLRIGENIAHAIATTIDQSYLAKTMLNNMTVAFADLVEKKDFDTGNHINRMTKYSKIVAEGLLNHDKNNYRVNSSFIQDIELYAPLHDIGKVGIPDHILNKPGEFEAEEWAIMKTHTNIGASILINLKDSLQIFGKQFYQMAIDITRHHHEKWDGSGYPYGLNKEEIPLAARIVAIADVFDALASKRPYKEPKSFDECVDIIKKGSGTHFDPELVDIFLKSLIKIKSTYDEDILNSSLMKAASV